MINNHVTYKLSDLDMRMVRAIPQGGNWKNIPADIPSKRVQRIRETGGRTTLYGRLEWNKPSYTITTYFNRPGNGTYIHPEEDRVITAREAARLQSFPDDYLFFGSKGSFTTQIGNAVPPLLAYHVAKKLKSVAKTKNVLDLFCGAGGLSKGFEWAGHNIIAANDNLAPACETYRNNHSSTKLIEGDITQRGVKDKIYEAINGTKIDLIIGGPPCQGFSNAGKRLVDDPRNFLFKEFVNIVDKVKPRAFLLENVEGILTSDGGKTFQSIKESFEELGYTVNGKKLLAANFGVPQKRKRVILIGLLDGDPEKCFPKELFKEEVQYLTVADAISDLPPIRISSEGLLEVSHPKTPYQKLMAGKIDLKEFLKDPRN